MERDCDNGKKIVILEKDWDKKETIKKDLKKLHVSNKMNFFFLVVV